MSGNIPWIKHVLLSDDKSTAEELVAYFTEAGVHEDEARHLVATRADLIETRDKTRSLERYRFFDRRLREYNERIQGRREAA